MEVTYENVIGKPIKNITFSANEIETLRHERILITGAGGSIGSRICKLLDSFSNVDFIGTDRDESALHSLSLNLQSRALFETSNFVLMDIKDQLSIRSVFESYKPTVVIHAAALKHLNVLEKQPYEAIVTNVFGTANLVDICLKKGVQKFVNISTDKAAEPNSVLGKSKFLAELYVASNRSVENSYTSCRFGNVFASRGSVIETFVSQIIKNQPITLSDENVSRFFMHADEAAQLTIKSLLINEDDIHIFKMGDAVKILQIINNLKEIFKSNCPIEITGLRPGEKLHEKLSNENENLRTSSNPLIYLSSSEISKEISKEILKAIKFREYRIIEDFITGT